MCVVLLLASSVALASPGKLKKADKLWDRFGSGDREALAEARESVDAAIAHPKVEGDPMAWALRGRIYLAFLTNADLPRPEVDVAGIALSSLEKAHELRGVGLGEDVLALEASVVSQLMNHVEAKRWDDAEHHLELALRARELGQQVASRDEQREVEVRSLGVRVAAAGGDLDAAREHFYALLDLGRVDTGLAGLIARKLADAGDAEGALAFLDPLMAKVPDDERLLRTQIDLLLEQDRASEAVVRIDRAREQLSTSVSGAFLIAELYEQAGDIQQARSAWEHVLTLDERHQSSLLALGASLVDEAEQVRASLEEEEDAEARPLSRQQVARLEADLADLWARAEEHLRAAHEVDRQSAPVLEALVALYEAKWGEVESADELPRELREPFEVDRQALAEARSALEELQ
jgi:tetratricopeptide (TPR) repeat protein